MADRSEEREDEEEVGSKTSKGELPDLDETGGSEHRKEDDRVEMREGNNSENEGDGEKTPVREEEGHYNDEGAEDGGVMEGAGGEELKEGADGEGASAEVRSPASGGEERESSAAGKEGEDMEEGTGDGEDSAGRRKRERSADSRSNDKPGEEPRDNWSNVGKLFVGGIPVKWSDDDLREYFAKMAKVFAARIITDRETGNSRGFGFVSFESDEVAQKILADTGAQLTIEGKKVTLKVAKDKTELSRAEGRGGDRFDSKRSRYDDARDGRRSDIGRDDRGRERDGGRMGGDSGRNVGYKGGEVVLSRRDDRTDLRSHIRGSARQGDDVRGGRGGYDDRPNGDLRERISGESGHRDVGDRGGADFRDRISGGGDRISGGVGRYADMGGKGEYMSAAERERGRLVEERGGYRDAPQRGEPVRSSAMPARPSTRDVYADHRMSERTDARDAPRDVPRDSRMRDERMREREPVRQDMHTRERESAYDNRADRGGGAYPSRAAPVTEPRRTGAYADEPRRHPDDPRYADPRDSRADPRDSRADPRDSRADPRDSRADPRDSRADPRDSRADPRDRVPMSSSAKERDYASDSRVGGDMYRDPYMSSRSSDPYARSSDAYAEPSRAKDPYSDPYRSKDPYLDSRASDPYPPRSSDPYPPPRASDQYRTKDPYSEPSRAKDPYAKDPYAKDPYAKDPYAKDPYAKDPYAKDPYASKHAFAEERVASKPVRAAGWGTHSSSQPEANKPVRAAGWGEYVSSATAGSRASTRDLHDAPRGMIERDRERPREPERGYASSSSSYANAPSARTHEPDSRSRGGGATSSRDMYSGVYPSSSTGGRSADAYDTRGESRSGGYADSRVVPSRGTGHSERVDARASWGGYSRGGGSGDGDM